MNKQSCSRCGFILNSNDEPLKVLKMIQNRKKSGDDKEYPMLVCDFFCESCNNHIIVNWTNCLNINNISVCEKCSSPLKVNSFLGKMKGFNLQSFCLSCYKKINEGNIQK